MYILEQIFERSNYPYFRGLHEELAWLFWRYKHEDNAVNDFGEFVIELLLDGQNWLYDSNTLQYDLQILLYVKGYISKEQVIDNLDEIKKEAPYFESALSCFYISESSERYKKTRIYSISSKLKKEIERNDITNIPELTFWYEKNVIKKTQLDFEISSILLC